MTAINLVIQNHDGHVVHGNSLTNTCELIYETGQVQITRPPRHVHHRESETFYVLDGALEF